MILIADSSALIALATCDCLGLLDTLFKTVAVPEAVYYEATRPNKKQAIKLKTYLVNKVKKANMQDNIFLKDRDCVDVGETEAMILYKQLNANKLLIDDQRGREVAEINEINTIGSLGILLVAKQEKLIQNIAPYLKVLEKSDIYLSKQVINAVLELAEETTNQ